MKTSIRLIAICVCFLAVVRAYAAEESEQETEKACTPTVESTPAQPVVEAKAAPESETATVAPAEVATAEVTPAENTQPQPVVEAKAVEKSEPAKVPAAETAQPQPLVWLDNYSKGMKQAEAEHKYMLIHFFRPDDQKRAEAATASDSVVNIEKVLEEPGIREKLDQYVLVKLPVDAQITVKGEPTRLLGHKSFGELHNDPGIAVIDFAHPKEEYNGYVISVLPFMPGKYYRFRPNHLQVLFDLPPGSLTQRSMILAVRIHPEHPASTNGEEDPVLLSEASGHSVYQAQIHVQGHQDWDSRFQRIISKLFRRGTPGTPVEVVAESWPNQDLMDSCVDCVASWRQSEGHWNAVKAQQASYGYDIREGDNGIWYATGIFRPKE